MLGTAGMNGKLFKISTPQSTILVKNLAGYKILTLLRRDILSGKRHKGKFW